MSPFCGRMIAPSAPGEVRNWRPRSSWISRTALSTPRVTSSTGASTVVGASPRVRNRYSPASFFSIRIAFVVVDPQSVAITERTLDGSISLIASGVSRARLEPLEQQLDRPTLLQNRLQLVPARRVRPHDADHRPQEDHHLT